ncbi:MAG: prepilin-type N-terminal cleavage/methylation domain-containing protein [Candidatus Wallbacteria bacterium]
MFKKTKNLKPGNKAFTIVEVLVTLAISSLLLIFLINFFKEGLFQNESADVKADNLRETRMSLLHFEKDMREAAAILNFDDNDKYTNVQIKKYKDDGKTFEYVIYTLYKTEQTVVTEKLPFSLCRNVIAEAPKATDVAIKPIIKGVEKSLGQVGLVQSAKDSNGNEIFTEIAAYNMHYDPSYINNPYLSTADKEKERARARYMGRYNNNMVGFTEKSKIVGFEITVITNDQQKIVNVYRSFIFPRKPFYDVLTNLEDNPIGPTSTTTAN